MTAGVPNARANGGRSRGNGQSAFDGSAGGGGVMATVSGDGRLVSADTSSEVIDPDDPEMLSNLVVAALDQATKAANESVAQQMGGLASWLDLRGLLG